MDRFTRFKLLRAIWARAKNLLAWLYGPRAREERLRAHMLQQINVAQRWQQTQVSERQLRDGQVRGIGDPDSAAAPAGADSQQAAYQAWRAHLQAHHQAQEAAHRQNHSRRGR